MFDLALECGVPAETLAKQMSERELRAWTRRAATHGLPTRRLEWLLAQVAFVIARVNGAKDVNIKDFMLKAANQGPSVLEAAKVAFGFKPRKKK